MAGYHRARQFSLNGEFLYGGIINRAGCTVGLGSLDTLYAVRIMSVGWRKISGCGRPLGRWLRRERCLPCLQRGRRGISVVRGGKMGRGTYRHLLASGTHAFFQ